MGGLCNWGDSKCPDQVGGELVRFPNPHLRRGSRNLTRGDPTMRKNTPFLLVHEFRYN